MERLPDRDALAAWRTDLGEIALGLVPTMGALHAGHESLVRAAREACERVLVSIFVNPLQFDESADFEAYPRPFEEDLRTLEGLGADAVYLPTPGDMYPQGFETRIVPGASGRGFEGACRPGHFEGVLTVVYKLLVRARPARAFFGEKDAQQLHLVRRMVEDLELPVEITSCPTVRETDGLALSSRNVHLGPEERERAGALYRALTAARTAFAGGERDPAALAAVMEEVFARAGLEPEYAAVVDDRLFRTPERLEPGMPCRAVTAARVGRTRLIDNLFLGHA